jgi:hypothetical protein
MRAFSGDVLFQTTDEIRKKVKELFQNKVRAKRLDFMVMADAR